MSERELDTLRRTVGVMSALGQSLVGEIEATLPPGAMERGRWLTSLLSNLTEVGQAAAAGERDRAAEACRLAFDDIVAAETQGSSIDGEEPSLFDAMSTTDADAALLTHLKHNLADLARVYSEDEE